MARRFKKVDYEEALDQTVTIRECLPPDHLARFIVAIILLLDLSAIYAGYAAVGGEAYAPEVLLGLLFYGYATGVFSSRKIEKATYEAIPFRFIAGGLHPAHDTIANFRKTFLPEITALFAQVLVVACEMGLLQLGNISLDGSKVHADASKSHAVSYGRLLTLEQQLRREVEELLALAEQADQGALPEGLDVEVEIALRQERLANLALAREVLEARAQEQYEAEKAEYEAKLQKREEKAQQTGRKPRGRAPQPPTPGPRVKDQYNFTDPESRVMKNSNNDGFDQHYNVQAAVDQDSRLIVGNTVSNHPNDKGEAIPTVEAIPAEVGKPQAAALDNGYFSPTNIEELETRGIDPYIATGRDPHHQSWQERFAQEPEPPAEDASPIVKMAYKLKTDIGKIIYGLRKSTVEPVIGIIKETLGFRQFSLRGLIAVAGEWCLVCLAYNLKRLHVLVSS
ncbi:MAG: Transposase DDE domain protein [Chloroflexi bacterium ADurb.Bin360]|nr:MAG: Transposase DDE domain protein [Chloroflexi bacterium ADurb.Bin360]HOC21431.1 IS1182 family transposase [Anaerolineae bacterium]HQM14157.1 IS1182 family transposase [Anaerolineae bacterium]